jgi:hypothetical protein
LSGPRRFERDEGDGRDERGQASFIPLYSDPKAPTIVVVFVRIKAT